MIGAGVTSQVFRGCFGSRPVAVKRLEVVSEQGEVPVRVLNEVQSLVELAGCPNVVELVAVRVEGEKLLIALEQCEMDLRRYLDMLEEPMEASVVRAAARMLLVGLSVSQALGTRNTR